MNNSIDFSQIPLRDIHLPSPVGWWPLALGWWIVLFALLAVAGFVWYRYRRTYRARAALRAVKRVMTSLQQGAEPTSCAQQISIVLRRFAMSIGARGDAVAGLTGPGWLQYLDSRWERHSFTDGAGHVLVTAPYAPAGRIDSPTVEALGALCIEWINAQRAAKS
jgi:hypothetical protein